jgi:hypothetical protein
MLLTLLTSVRSVWNALPKTKSKSEYMMCVMGIGRVEETRIVKSEESPAVCVLREFGKPEYSGKRVWVADHGLHNRFPHRFRLFTHSDGTVKARMIDPRRR